MLRAGPVRRGDGALRGTALGDPRDRVAPPRPRGARLVRRRPGALPPGGDALGGDETEDLVRSGDRPRPADGDPRRADQRPRSDRAAGDARPAHDARPRPRQDDPHLHPRPPRRAIDLRARYRPRRWPGAADRIDPRADPAGDPGGATRSDRAGRRTRPPPHRSRDPRPPCAAARPLPLRGRGGRPRLRHRRDRSAGG